MQGWRKGRVVAETPFRIVDSPRSSSDKTAACPRCACRSDRVENTSPRRRPRPCMCHDHPLAARRAGAVWAHVLPPSRGWGWACEMRTERADPHPYPTPCTPSSESSVHQTLPRQRGAKRLTVDLHVLPWPKKLKQPRARGTGAWSVEHARAYVWLACLFQFFWPG